MENSREIKNYYYLKQYSNFHYSHTFENLLSKNLNPIAWEVMSPCLLISAGSFY